MSSSVDIDSQQCDTDIDSHGVYIWLHVHDTVFIAQSELDLK